MLPKFILKLEHTYVWFHNNSSFVMRSQAEVDDSDEIRQIAAQRRWFCGQSLSWSTWPPQLTENKAGKWFIEFKRDYDNLKVFVTFLG